MKANILLFLLAGSAAAQSTTVLRPVPEALDPRAAVDPKVLESRVVDVDFAALDAELATGVVRLDLLGRTRDVVAAAVQRSEPGVFHLSGHLADEPSASCVLAVRDGHLAANVRSRHGVIAVRSLGDGRHAVRRVDSAGFGGCGHAPAAASVASATPPGRRPSAPMAPSGGATGTAAGVSPAGNDPLAGFGTPDVDVLFVYTRTAAAAAGGHRAMLANIDLALAEANDALLKSDANVMLWAAGVVDVDYAEPNNLAATLFALQTPGDGILDEVIEWREIVGADVVSLWVDDGGLSPSEACGVANTMTVVGPAFAPLAFNVCNWDCAVTDLWFAHETAHALGCAHDPFNAPIGGAYPYSFGHPFDGTGGEHFLSVMAMGFPDPGTRIPRFSNPVVDWDGAPTGIDNERDNAKTMRNTGAVVQDFRPVPALASDVYVKFAPEPFFEDGTSANPYNTLEEGFLAVQPGGTVWLQGATLDPPFLGWRHMTLTGWNGGGKLD